ncbi:HNH endonuclease [Ruegeria arenilitoris]|uniref:HNH endonuclease n=1 Tax=Ruegeria arenilitoris TaxID=1173585 RepID=UPI0014819DC1|nr:HNH endonuclease signature motif containing protein [Ruegeria arenilitoris]
MALRISAKLKKALSEELKKDKSEIEDYVWNHKEQKCFLCSEKLNRASDDIELDHDVPEGEGGSNAFENLNLAHVECNRYKRNHSSFDVRPHLKFKRFYESKLGEVHFGDAMAFFEITPTECYLQIDDTQSYANIQTTLGEERLRIHKEVVNGKEQFFCFATLPVSCILNDADIQPREIKINHLFAISADLKKNPLHEQPAIRIAGNSDKKLMLMFDGQHKTVAHMLNGNHSCTFKIYLNIEKPEAVHLVNSIQARIKMLPLTPFELASKMSDEVRRKLEAYEHQIGSTEVSEEGFISWLDPADRTRAKSGIEAAVVDRIIGDSDLAFMKIVERKGIPTSSDFSVKEPAFKKMF